MTIYDNMKFAPYEFKEYPKRIQLIGQTGEVREIEVNSKSDELSYVDQWAPRKEDAHVKEVNTLSQQIIDQAARIKELEEKIALSKGVKVGTTGIN